MDVGESYCKLLLCLRRKVIQLEFFRKLQHQFLPVLITWLRRTKPPQARFPFKRNRLRCVRCVSSVNENRKKRKRLRFLRFSFTQRTQRTQRKRLRLNGNRALVLTLPNMTVPNITVTSAIIHFHAANVTLLSQQVLAC